MLQMGANCFMKKPQNLLEAYTLAEGCKSRKKAKKLLKYIDKHHDLLKVRRASLSKT